MSDFLIPLSVKFIVIMEKTDKGINILEKILELIKKYSTFDFLKGFLLIILAACVFGIISNPDWFFQKYNEWSEKEHSKRIEVRMKNNEKLHILSEKLMYKISAKRVMILELHNGLENSAGLPFSKCSATYEALNEGVVPVSEQYQNVNLSLMPFATELFDNEYWCGNINELKNIDRGLYYKMASNYTEHFAACVIKGVEKPLALLFVSYDEIDGEHSCDDVRKSIKNVALEYALLLELNKINKR